MSGRIAARGSLGPGPLPRLRGGVPLSCAGRAAPCAGAGAPPLP